MIMNDSLSEQLKDRLNTRPDPQTTAWLRKQYTECWDAYRSVSHVAAMAHGNSLRVIDRVTSLEFAMSQKDSEITELRALIGELTARLDKASDVVKKLRKQESDNANV